MVVLSIHDPQYSENDAVSVYNKFAGNYTIRHARFMSPLGHMPDEVLSVWQNTVDGKDTFRRTRGFIGEGSMWIPLKENVESDGKYWHHTVSEDSKLEAFVETSLDLKWSRVHDLIEIRSVPNDQKIVSLSLPANEMHGPVIMKGSNMFLQFSPDNRKLLYTARPTDEQREMHKDRVLQFVMCIYDLPTNKVAVVTDPYVCARTIVELTWMPSNDGVVFYSEDAVFFKKFAGPAVKTNFPSEKPVAMKFSTVGDRIAVFIRDEAKDSIITMSWPQSEIKRYRLNDGYRVWSVPDRPWTLHGRMIVFNVVKNTRVTPIIMNLTPGHEGEGSIGEFAINDPATVLDVRDDEILIEKRCINSDSALCKFRMFDIEAPDVLLQHAGDERLNDFTVVEEEFGDGAFSGIVMYSKTAAAGAKMPMVVVPGDGADGNESGFTTIDLPTEPAVLARIGFLVLLVNYRTPTSYATPECIDDVHAAVLATLEKYEDLVEKDDVNLYGVMFGSFVTASLLIKHPEFYTRCALCQPILSVSPIIKASGMVKLQKQEPRRGVDKIRTPCLVTFTGPQFLYLYKEFNATLHKNGLLFGEKFCDESEAFQEVVKFFRAPVTSNGKCN